MSQMQVEVQGTLQPDGVLVLDRKPALPPGRVRVLLQSVAGGMEGCADVIAVLKQIHAEQAVRGHNPRSREEIDAAIAAMRSEDEERMRAIERLFEQSRSAQNQPPSPGQL